MRNLKNRPNRKITYIKPMLEQLENRIVLYTAQCSFTGTLSGAFLNNNDVLNLTNALYGNGNNWQIKNQQLKVTDTGPVYSNSASSIMGGGSTDNITPTDMGTTMDTSSDGTGGKYFSGMFGWKANGSVTNNYIRGYGYFYGHVDGDDVVDSGEYFETILDGPASNYWYWQGGGGGYWSNSTWKDAYSNTHAAGAPPDGSFVILDGSNNTATTVDQGADLAALVISGGYNNTITLGTGPHDGATLQTGNYVDAALGAANEDNDQLNVNFASGGSSFMFGGIYATTASNIAANCVGYMNFGQSGSGVAVANDSVDFAQVGKTHTTATTFAVANGAYLFTGAWDDNPMYASSGLLLTSDYANFSINGQVVVDSYGGITDISTTSTKTDLTVYTGGSLDLDTVARPPLTSDTINIPIYISGGTLNVGGGSYNSAKNRAIQYKFTEPDLVSTHTNYGYDVYMATGTITLNNNASLIFTETASCGGFGMFGGTFIVDYTGTVYLTTPDESVCPINFAGGTIQFNNSQGPNNFGSLSVSGYVNFDGTMVDMIINGTAGSVGALNNCDTIVDPDTNPNFNASDASKINITTIAGGNATVGFSWQLILLADGESINGTFNTGTLAGTSLTYGDGSNALKASS